MVHTPGSAPAQASVPAHPQKVVSSKAPVVAALLKGPVVELYPRGGLQSSRQNRGAISQATQEGGRAAGIFHMRMCCTVMCMQHSQMLTCFRTTESVSMSFPSRALAVLPSQDSR